jgi:TolA-binding protein
MVKTFDSFFPPRLGAVCRRLRLGRADRHADRRRTIRAGENLFDKEDYLEAINEFTIITLQFQGSQHAADAQFYLGDCRFKRGRVPPRGI